MPWSPLFGSSRTRRRLGAPLLAAALLAAGQGLLGTVAAPPASAAKDATCTGASGAGGAVGIAAPAENPTSAPGYWVALDSGTVCNFGDAPYYGGEEDSSTTDMAAVAGTPTGHGYWTMDAAGGVYAYGEAAYEGGGSNGPAWVGIAPDESDTAYWLVASDGTIDAEGSAPSYLAVNQPQPVVGVAGDPASVGLWTVTSAGVVSTRGHAAAYGSAPSGTSDAVGIAATGDGDGYWIADAQGDVWAQGDAVYKNDLPGLGVGVSDIAAITGNGSDDGYWLLGSDGAVYAFGSAAYEGGTNSGSPDAPGATLLPGGTAPGSPWSCADDETGGYAFARQAVVTVPNEGAGAALASTSWLPSPYLGSSPWPASSDDAIAANAAATPSYYAPVTGLGASVEFGGQFTASGAVGVKGETEMPTLSDGSQPAPADTNWSGTFHVDGGWDELPAATGWDWSWSGSASPPLALDDTDHYAAKNGLGTLAFTELDSPAHSPVQAQVLALTDYVLPTYYCDAGDLFSSSPTGGTGYKKTDWDGSGSSSIVLPAGATAYLDLGVEAATPDVLYGLSDAQDSSFSIKAADVVSGTLAGLPAGCSAPGDYPTWPSVFQASCVIALAEPSGYATSGGTTVFSPVASEGDPVTVDVEDLTITWLPEVEMAASPSAQLLVGEQATVSATPASGVPSGYETEVLAGASASDMSVVETCAATSEPCDYAASDPDAPAAASWYYEGKLVPTSCSGCPTETSSAMTVSWSLPELYDTAPEGFCAGTSAVAYTVDYPTGSVPDPGADVAIGNATTGEEVTGHPDPQPSYYSVSGWTEPAAGAYVYQAVVQLPSGGTVDSNEITETWTSAGCTVEADDPT